MIANFSAYGVIMLHYDTPGTDVHKPTNVQYLGNEATYCGILDLRLFEAQDAVDPTVCNVRGNTIIVSYNTGWGVPAASKNNAKLVGLRVTHWPLLINVTDNVFEIAPIILQNNWWNNQNDSTHTRYASKIKISNNKMEIPVVLPCAIDITPASGVVGAPHSPQPVFRQTVEVVGNAIEVPTGQEFVANYEDFGAVVRLGQLDGIFKSEVAPPALPLPARYPDDQINTDDLFFEWLISDNLFDGTRIIMGYGMPTAANATQATDEEGGDYAGKLTVVDGGYDWAGGGASALPDGPRLIVVENNMFTFNSGSPPWTDLNPGHIFGSDRRLGVARLYVGNLVGATVDGGNFCSVFNVNMHRFPDTVGQQNTGGFTSTQLESALIVQNNSASFDSTDSTQHAFSGSDINQG